MQKISNDLSTENKRSPGLFGIERSNRDFSKSENWGKNIFNNTFPVSLACYMASKKLDPIYLKFSDKENIIHSKVAVIDVFGMEVPNDKLYFSFEGQYSPYETISVGSPPRVDLVTYDVTPGQNAPLRPIEIKLTALPDYQTNEKQNEAEYGSELVIRPDTIVYTAMSIASKFSKNKLELRELLNEGNLNQKNLRDASTLLAEKERMVSNLIRVVAAAIDEEKPLLLEPVWKTKGRTLILADRCFDIFVWSDLSFSKLLLDRASGANGKKIRRPLRAASWLYHMLSQYAETGTMDSSSIIDELTYGTKNDKAFSVGGNLTNPYMKSPELTSPRIHKESIDKSLQASPV